MARKETEGNEISLSSSCFAENLSYLKAAFSRFSVSLALRASTRKDAVWVVGIDRENLIVFCIVSSTITIYQAYYN